MRVKESEKVGLKLNVQKKKKKKIGEEGIPKREMSTCKKQENMIVMDTKLETQMIMMTR